MDLVHNVLDVVWELVKLALAVFVAVRLLPHLRLDGAPAVQINQNVAVEDEEEEEEDEEPELLEQDLEEVPGPDAIPWEGELQNAWLRRLEVLITKNLERGRIEDVERLVNLREKIGRSPVRLAIPTPEAGACVGPTLLDCGHPSDGMKGCGACAAAKG